MNIEGPSQPVVRFNTSPARPSGEWGRAGPVLGPRGLYMMTATGPYNPAEGLFGDSFVLLELETLRLLDYFSPENRDYIRERDYGGSTSPFVVRFRGRDIVVGTNKESVIWLLDSNSLGGGDHETPLYTSPRWANDDGWMHGRGVWGAMATWEDPSGERWIYVPIWGPPTSPFPEWPIVHGMQESRSIMAFRMGIEDGNPMWNWAPRIVHGSVTARHLDLSWASPAAIAAILKRKGLVRNGRRRPPRMTRRPARTKADRPSRVRSADLGTFGAQPAGSVDRA